MSDRLRIDRDGRLHFIYGDHLRPLLDLGRPTTTRASHVEPTADSRWTADLGPSGGPVLGPFDRREDALEAERQWIEEHLLGGR